MAGARMPKLRLLQPVKLFNSMRDFQRSRMYAWETQFIRDLAFTPRTIPQCRVVAALCASLYAVVPPYLPARPRSRKRGLCGRNGKIQLPPFARRDYYIIHESAHHVINELFDTGLSHGGVFMRVVIELLHTVAGLNRVDMLWGAIEKRLCVAPPDIITQAPMEEARELTSMWFQQADIDPLSGQPRWQSQPSQSHAHAGEEMKYDDFRFLLRDEYVVQDDSFLPPSYLQ